MVKLVEKASARSLGVEHRISGKQLRSYVGGRVTLLQNIRRMLRAKIAEALPDEDCNVKFRTQYMASFGLTGISRGDLTAPLKFKFWTAQKSQSL